MATTHLINRLMRKMAAREIARHETREKKLWALRQFRQHFDLADHTKQPAGPPPRRAGGRGVRFYDAQVVVIGLGPGDLERKQAHFAGRGVKKAKGAVR